MTERMTSMLLTRTSRLEDIPAQRQLWQLAFGDDETYIDNFYRTYYQSQRMLVLEEDGQICSMTAWFDTNFVVPGQGEFRAAYLYAVATYPHCRGRGLAGKLLADADDFFRGLDIPAVTTVPAEPSLHNFFGANGFGECFRHFEGWLSPHQLPAGVGPVFRPASPEAYARARQALLAHIPHIAYPEQALEYQAGCCALSGGGLFVGHTSAGEVCLCAEGAGNGIVVVKELLGNPDACRLALPDLPRVAPAQRWLVRGPSTEDEPPAGFHPVQFGMLKWLDPEQKKAWDWSSTGYLGLAFD